jgi:hypothetical protein
MPRADVCLSRVSRFTYGGKHFPAIMNLEELVETLVTVPTTSSDVKKMFHVLAILCISVFPMILAINDDCVPKGR